MRWWLRDPGIGLEKLVEEQLADQRGEDDVEDRQVHYVPPSGREQARRDGVPVSREVADHVHELQGDDDDREEVYLPNNPARSSRGRSRCWADLYAQKFIAMKSECITSRTPSHWPGRKSGAARSKVAATLTPAAAIRPFAQARPTRRNRRAVATQ